MSKPCRLRRLLTTFALFAVVAFGFSRPAAAQYKNTSFGVYVGGGYLFPGANDLKYYQEANYLNPYPNTTGSAHDNLLGFDGTTATNPHGLPYGAFVPMLSFEFSFKISLDQWWLKAGLNLGLVSVVDDKADFPPGSSTSSSGTTTSTAGATGGLALYIEGMFGPRVYFLTDNIRPYAEFGVRVGGIAGANGLIPTNLTVFPGVYATLGIEFIVTRDIAISVLGRFSRILIWDYPGFFIGEGQAGMVFYL